MSPKLKRAGAIAAAILAGLLVLLLAAPALIDWNAYRDEIAARIEAELGRDVDIGALSVRLLPSPALSASEVTVANLEGALPATMARVERVRLDVALAPLLTGRVAIQSLVLEKPELHLATLADGRSNWTFAPRAAESGAPESAPQPAADEAGDAAGGIEIAIDRVVVRNGLASWGAGRGAPAATAHSIDARIDMKSLAGPFAARGSLGLGDAPLAFEAVVDRIGPDRGTPITARLSSEAGSAQAEFSGMLSRLSGGMTLRGSLGLAAADPAATLRAFGAPAAPPLPKAARLDAKAALALDSAGLSLEDLALSLGEARAAGSVEIAFADTPAIDAKLAVSGLDLDKWTGAPAEGARPAPAPAPAPAASPSPQAGTAATGQDAFSLPKDLFATLDLSAGSLAWRGDAIRDARLEAALTEGELVIRQAAAQLPGNSRVELRGTLAAEGGRPAFDGDFSAVSDNPRRLLAWLDVEVPKIREDRLHRLAARTTLRLRGEMLEARDIDLAVDTVRVRGAVTARLGGRKAFGVSLAAGSINLDHYLPGEKPAAPAQAGGGEGAPAASAAPAPEAAAPAFPALADTDVSLMLTVDEIVLNAVPARGLALDATLANGDLAVRRAAIGDLAGASIRAEGALKGLAGGAPRVEEFTFAAQSPQPARLFRFLGIDLPVPAERLGTLSASGRLDGDLSAVALDARVGAGGLEAKAQGSLAPLAGPSYDLALSLGHPSFAQAIRLFEPGYAPQGQTGALTASAKLKGDAATAEIGDLAIAAGPARLTGRATLALAGKPTLTGELSGNAIDLDPFMPARRSGWLLLPVPGGLRIGPASVPVPPPAGGAVPVQAGAAGPWSRAPLGFDALSAFDADFAVNAKSVTWSGWTLDNLAARLAVADGALDIRPFTGTLMGGAFTFSGRLAGGSSPGMTGTLSVAGADLGKARLGGAGLSVTRGLLDAQASWAARGASTQAMADTLAGEGRLAVKDGLVEGFDLPAVNRRLANIENVGSLLALVQAGLSGGSTRFSRLSGTFRAENGVVSSRDLTLEAEGGGGTAEGRVDLGRWTIDARAGLRLADTQAPALVVRLEGPLGSPRKIVDVNALQQYLVAKGLGRALGGKGGAGGLIQELLGGGARQDQQQPRQQRQQQQQQPSGKQILQDLLKGFGR